jgi:hypothetical protein
MFTFDNALELTLLAGLVRFGFGPRAAAHCVRSLFEDWRYNGRQDWALFFLKVKNLPSAISFEGPPYAELISALQDLQEDEGAVYTILNVGKLAKKIEQLISEPPSRSVN